MRNSLREISPNDEKVCDRKCQSQSIPQQGNCSEYGRLQSPDRARRGPQIWSDQWDPQRAFTFNVSPVRRVSLFYVVTCDAVSNISSTLLHYRSCVSGAQQVRRSRLAFLIHIWQMLMRRVGGMHNISLNERFNKCFREHIKGTPRAGGWKKLAGGEALKGQLLHLHSASPSVSFLSFLGGFLLLTPVLLSLLLHPYRTPPLGSS